MRRFGLRRVATCVGLGALCVVACGDDGDEQRSPKPVAAAPDAAVAELRTIDPSAISFDELMARFDVNGDDRIDATDVADLERCVAAGDPALDDLGCDLVPDGNIDEQDQYALRLVLGEVRRKSDEEIRALAEGLRALADAGSPVTPASLDYDRDDASTAADLRKLAELLQANPNQALDVDGDGSLGPSDVGDLARRQARVALGRDAEVLDVNGDGASDIQDTYLLAEISSLVAEQSFGLFDHDLNGRVDRDDFCSGSAAASAALRGDGSVFDLLMPPGEAAAAEAEPSGFWVCRGDGRSDLRNFVGLQDPQQIRVEPVGLYLNEVTSPPQGYAPVAPDRLTGRRLFVVSSTPSEWPLRALELPWGAHSSERSSLSTGGVPLPESASLLVPTGVLDLESGVPSGARVWKRQARTDYSAPVFDLTFDDAAKASASSFFQRMSEAQAAYAQWIAGCPCELDAGTRQELVRWLVRAKHCLDSDLGVARARLEAARVNQARVARLSISASNEAAARWTLLADDIWTMEVVSSLLLVAETGYDFASGGLGKAFAGAAANGAAELDKDLRADNGFFVESGKSLALGLPAGALEMALTETLRGISRNPAAPTGLKDFTRQVVDGVVKELKSPVNGKALGKSQLEAVVKILIKAIPAAFVKFSQTRALESETRASDLGAEVWRLNLEVGQLQNVVRELEAASAELKELRAEFLAKLSADGCAMSITTTDPCSFDLEAALGAAQAALDSDLSSADADLESALGATPSGEGECTTGSTRKELDADAVGLSGAARQIWESARGGSAEAGMGALDTSAGEAAERFEGTASDFRGVCDLFAQPQISEAQVQAINDAQDARVAAQSRFNEAAKLALETYEQCLLAAGESGGSCGFDGDLAFTSPWDAAAKCVGCLPSANMDCGSVLSPSFVSLGSDLSISMTDLQVGYIPLSISMIVHSSTNVPTQATAGDHTTLTGYFAGRITLDSSAAGALFSGPFACGAHAMGSTLCPPGSPPGAGDFIVLITDYGAVIPSNDSGQIYQYGFVFDSDAGAANYVPTPPYTNDFFGGTDLWFEANRSASGTWSLKATDASQSGFPAATTQARIAIRGDAMAFIAPASEFAEMRPAFRFSAFRHTGDYGLNPPYDWDGSVFPSVANGLQPFP